MAPQFDGAALLGATAPLPFVPHSGSVLADGAAVLRACNPIESIDLRCERCGIGRCPSAAPRSSGCAPSTRCAASCDTSS